MKQKTRASLQSVGIAAAVLVVLIGSIIGIKADQIKVMTESGENAVQPPETISTFTAQAQRWPVEYQAVGTVEADEGITISAQVPGKVKRIAFSSGAYVKAGDILIEQESVNEQAQLDAAEARLKLAKANLQRLTELKTRNIATQSEVDAAQQQLGSAQGDVDDLTATLQKKLIRAPFDGRLGIRQVDLGTDLQVGTAIVSLQATNRVRVNFPVPQEWLVQMKTGLPVNVVIKELNNSTVSGQITAIGAEINTLTRNAIVQSSLDNSANQLIPGMAVRVVVTLADPIEVLAVPATAVVYAPFGDTLFVVDKADNGDLIARQQFIQLGESRGDFVAVKQGLKAGEQVVSAGAFKLFNKQKVVVGTKPTPEFRTEPNPTDS